MKFLIGVQLLFFSTFAYGQMLDSILNLSYNQFDDINETYTKNRYKVSVNGSLGIYDSLGGEILPPIYDWIGDEDPSLDSYYEGFIFVGKSDSIYLLNLDYQLLLPFAYDSYCGVWSSSDVGFLLAKNDRLGLYLKGKGLVVSPEYIDVNVGVNFFLFKNENEEQKLFYFSEKGSATSMEVVETNGDLIYSDQALLITGSNEKLGVLNADLDTIVDFKYERNSLFLKNQFIYLKIDDDWFCLSENNDWEPLLVQNIELVKKGNFSYDRSIVNYKSKFAQIDHLGNLIIPHKYDGIETVHHGAVFYYYVKKAKKKALFDVSGNQITKFSFNSIEFFDAVNFLVSKKDKYGIIDSSGKLIVPLIYDHIYKTNKNYFKVANQNQIGLLDSVGQVLFVPEFTKEVVNNEKHLAAFSRDFQRFEKRNGDFITVNQNGAIILPDLYDSLIHSLTAEDARTYRSLHNYYLVKKDGLYGVISSEKEMIPPVFEWIDEREFYLDTLVPFKKNGKSGYFSLNDLTERYYGQFDHCEPFVGHFAVTVKNNKKGLINRYGDELLKPIYDSLKINYHNGNLNSRLLNIITYKSGNKGGDLRKSYGLYGLKNNQFIIPTNFQKIKHVEGVNNPYFTAFDKDKDSTHIYSLRQEGGPFFKIVGNPYHFKYHASSQRYDAHFKMMRIDKNVDGNKVIEYYTLNGVKIQKESLEIKAVVPEIIEDYIEKHVKTQVDSLNEEYDYLNQISGSNFYPQLFDLPKIYIVKKAGVFGVVDMNQKVIVPFVYDNIFTSATNRYLTVTKGTKYGWVTRTGEVVLPIIYDGIAEINEPISRGSDSGLFLLESNGLFGVCDIHGNLIIPVIYETLATDLNGVRFHIGHAKGVSEVYSGQMSSNSFNSCSPPYGVSLANAKAIRENPHGYAHQIQLLRKNIIFPAKIDGLWGLIDQKGNLKLPIIYDEIYMTTGLIAQLRKADEITFFDLETNQLLPFSCDTIFSWREFGSYNKANRAEVLIFRSNGKYGLFNPFTKQILPAKYDAIEQNFPEFDYFSFFKEDGSYDPEKEDNLNTDVHTSWFLTRYKLDGKIGLINLYLFVELGSKTYSQLKIYSSSKAAVLNLDDKMTFLNSNNRQISNVLYDSVSHLLPSNYSYNNRKAVIYYKVKKAGLVGVMDENGNVIIPLIYDAVKSWQRADDFKNDQFLVQKNGKFGVVSQSGKIMIPFKYQEITFNLNNEFGYAYKLVKNGIITYRSIQEL